MATRVFVRRLQAELDQLRRQDAPSGIALLGDGASLAW